MHIVFGILIVAGSFLLSMNYMTAEFSGFFNMYSLILLIGVPIGLALISFRFSTLAAAGRGLMRAIMNNPRKERDRLAHNLVEFGREVRRDKGSAASAIVEREADVMFRTLGRHVVQRTDAEEIEADALIMGRRELDDYRQGEKVLNALGDFAPAMGMVGTIIGLIQLLANMRDFEKLGPGMAIALLTTFYGLLLAHLLYLPLARLVRDAAQQRTENLNLVVEGMLKLARRRPIHEVQQLVGMGDASTRSAA